MNRLFCTTLVKYSPRNAILPSRAVQWPRTLATTASNRHANTESTTSDAQHYDIIIVGGGMVGTALACALGKNSRLQNKNILLLEAAAGFKQPSTEQYSNRVSAISKGTYRLMRTIGAWEEIERTRVKPCFRRSVTAPSSSASSSRKRLKVCMFRTIRTRFSRGSFGLTRKCNRQRDVFSSAIF
uniref:Uncharacterized protein n=1 Tax=Anopheles coluzzii TaxID=1518534 RepID=A0A8W7PBJ3_ANOCL